MPVDAVVCAHNEASTVAAVVAALRASGVLARVLVVDDGSTDATSAQARAAGADVLALRPNGGKGAAMQAGVRATAPGRGPTDAVFFCDADLIGFTPDHARALVAALGPDCAQACGLRDYGPRWNALARAMPPITGERVVRRAVLAAVPADFWRGFRIEVGINAAATPARTCLQVLAGLKARGKWEKVGAERGSREALAMMAEVVHALRAATPVAPAGDVAPPTLAARTARAERLVAWMRAAFAPWSPAAATLPWEIAWSPWPGVAGCTVKPLYRLATRPPLLTLHWTALALPEAQLVGLLAHAFGHLVAPGASCNAATARARAVLGFQPDVPVINSW